MKLILQKTNGKFDVITDVLEISLFAYPDGEEGNEHLCAAFTIGETLEGELSVYGQKPLTLQVMGKRQIIIDQPLEAK